MEDKLTIDILHVWHPLKMSVRYKFSLRQYFELRDSMDQFYAIASSEETLLFRGRYVAVLHENRARFMKSVKVDCLKAKVLLIDFGEVYIYRFLQGHPGESHVWGSSHLCFPCCPVQRPSWCWGTLEWAGSSFIMEKINYERYGGTNVIKLKLEKPNGCWPPCWKHWNWTQHEF